MILRFGGIVTLVVIVKLWTTAVSYALKRVWEFYRLPVINVTAAEFASGGTEAVVARRISTEFTNSLDDSQTIN